MPTHLLNKARRAFALVGVLAIIASVSPLATRPAVVFSAAQAPNSSIKILQVTFRSLDEGREKQTILEGTAPAGTAITIFIERTGEDPIRKTARADEAGNWQLTLDYQLEPGSYSLWATESGNEQPVAAEGRGRLVVSLPALSALTPIIVAAAVIFPLLFLGFSAAEQKRIFAPPKVRQLPSRGPPLALTNAFPLLLLLTCSFILFQPTPAHAAINPKLNYQGKLTDGNYDAVADGAYHLEFKLYTAATGGSAIWTETWDNSYAFSGQVAGLVSESGTSVVYDNDAKEETLAVGQYLTNTTDSDYVLITAVDTGTNTLTTTATNKAWADDAAIHNRIRAVNGIFSVELGTVDGFSTSDYYDLADEQVTAAQWNGDLYLTVNVGGSGATPSWDGEMTPRKYVASTPQAHNADLLDGKDEAEFATLADNETVSGIWNFSSNVGIGTTAPAGALEIEIANDGAKTGLLVDQDDLDQIGMQIVQAADATASALDISSLQVSGDVLSIAWSASETQQGALTGIDVDLSNLIDDNASAIYGVHINDFNITGGGSGTQHGLYIEGTNWDWGIYNEDQTYLAGNVGIGTTGPGAKLHVTGGELWVGEDGVTAGKIVLRDNGSVSGEPEIYTDSLGSLFLDVISANGDISLNTNYISRLFINELGNVGIGTTAPGAGLEVEVASAGAKTGLLVDQDDLDQIGVQIVQAADATATALDISSLQVSGDVLNIAWSASETQQGALTGIDVDLSNLIDDNASAIYGVHINDFNITGGGGGTQYGLYIEGTNWDAGLYSAAASTIADTLTVGSGGNTFTFNPASGPVYAGDARPTKMITLSPEYSGGTLTAFHGAATDSSITGDMTADVETTAADGLRTYYEWTSSEATLQYYTVATRVRLPKDFHDWEADNAFQVDFTTESITNTNCFLDVFIYLSSNSTTAVASDADDNAAAEAETWEAITIDDSVLDNESAPDWDAADEIAIIYLRMASKDDNFVRIGDIRLTYLAQF